MHTSSIPLKTLLTAQPSNSGQEYIQRTRGRDVPRRSIRRRVTPSASLIPARTPPARRFWLDSFTVLVLAASSIGVQASAYEDWIRQARQGQYQPAIEGLRQYQRQNPADLRAQYDLMRIHAWAGQAEEVLRIYQALPAGRTLPADVLQAVARAYKDTRQWEPALRLYREGERRFPGQAAFTMGLCMTLADAGQPSRALDCTQALQPATRHNPDYLLARSYIYRASGQN